MRRVDRRVLPRQVVSAKWDAMDDGTLRMTLDVPGVLGPKPDMFGKRFWLVDVEDKLPVKVRCGALDIQPRLVLKVFCPSSRRLVKKIRKGQWRTAMKVGQSQLTM